jgi:hypothetical protein
MPFIAIAKGAAMNNPNVHNQPGTATSEGDVVHLSGPSDVDVTLTPTAALETAKRLEDAAIDALVGMASGPPS